MIADRKVLEAAAKSLPSAPPTERDLEIFAAVKVDCRRQVDVAAEFGISQSRVSQICRDVKLWRAGVGVEDELAARDQKGVEAWLDAQRLENLYEHTLELFRRSCQPKRRERKGSNPRGEWQDETIDHQAGNLQCLRLASRLLELRWKMLEKCPQPSPQFFIHTDEKTFLDRLISMRHWAEHRGEVPRGKESAGTLAQRLLDELLGRGEKAAGANSTGPASSGTQPGVGRREPGVGSRGTQTASTGRGDAGAAEAAAHTAHNISVVPVAYEPAVDGDRGVVTDCPETACVEDAAESSSRGMHFGEGEKWAADMSGPSTAGPASGGTRRNAVSGVGSGGAGVSSGTQTTTTGRDYAEEERLALAELQRTFAVEIWPSMADQSVPTLLAEGQANLLLQGYTREQRRALLGWQRVMRMRKQGRAGG